MLNSNRNTELCVSYGVCLCAMYSRVELSHCVRVMITWIELVIGFVFMCGSVMVTLN